MSIRQIFELKIRPSATSCKIQHNSMFELVLSFIPAENFVPIQHCENKFKNGAFLIKSEFLRSSNCTLRFFRENNDKMSYFLPAANALYSATHRKSTISKNTIP